MTTDTINAASPDAAPVTVPGWCQRPGSDTPIHRRAESCDLVGVVTPGTRCVELRLPAGLIAELSWRGMVPETPQDAAESDAGSETGGNATTVIHGPEIGDLV